jgi:hypothetical protein
MGQAILLLKSDCCVALLCCNNSIDQLFHAKSRRIAKPAVDEPLLTNKQGLYLFLVPLSVKKFRTTEQRRNDDEVGKQLQDIYLNTIEKSLFLRTRPAQS